MDRFPVSASPVHGKKQADLYMSKVTVGTGEIQGTQYVSVNSGAPKQVVELLKQSYDDAFVQARGAHAEQVIYIKARELLSTHRIDVIARELKAIGISHTGGPCARICQPFFADKRLPICWIGRISRAFAALAAML